MRAPTPLVFPFSFSLALTVAAVAGIAGIVGVSGVATALAGPVLLDGLVTESPFVLKHAEVAAAPGVTENATVEFRGMIATKDGVLFGFFDRTKNTSAWVKEHDAKSEFNVHSYDAANDTVSLDYQGQKFALALSTAKISTAAPIVNPVARNGNGNGNTGGADNGNRRRGNGANGEAATKRPVDPQALESVAEKVKALRAQRQAAAANGGGGGAAGGVGATASTQTGDSANAAAGTAAPARQGRSNRNR